MEIKNKKIIAITGCAAGIAHTFMAAEGLENAGKELGAKVKVETHGTAGPDNVLTAKEIREADLVIIAADISVDKTRFVGKQLYSTDTHLAIADPQKLITEAFEKATKFKETLQKSNGSSSVEDTGNIQKEGKVLPHIMFSLSWMVPLVISGGLIMAIGNVFAMQPGWVTLTSLGFVGVLPDADQATAANGIYILQSVVDANPDLVNIYHVTDAYGGLWWRIPNINQYLYVVDGSFHGTAFEWINANGGQQLFEWGKVWSFEGRSFFNTLFSGGAAAMSLIYPVIAAGIAYSIAGKITFAPAFLGGWLMNDGNFLGLSIDGTPFGTGFLGAIVIGFFVGHIALQIKKIKVNRTFKGLCDLMLWPLLMGLSVIIVGRYIFGPILGEVTLWMYNGIILIGDIPGGNILLAAIVAGMICTDLGGPINKTALVAGTAIFMTSMTTSVNPNDWNFVPGTATQAAISIPPLIAFSGTLLFPKYFTNQERTLGTNASFMGLVGITEGAIPFAVSKPKAFLPANIIGGMVSGMLVTAFGFQFYGGLGSPLAPILGYVPSAVLNNYILSTMIWILCYATGVAAGLAVLWIALTLTFKSQKEKRIISELKSSAKVKIVNIKKQMKTTTSEVEKIKLKKEINDIKSELKKEIEKAKQEIRSEAKEANEIKNNILATENAKWEKEQSTLKGKIQKAKEASSFEKEQENFKKEVKEIKEKYASEANEIKSDKQLTKEDKKFKISEIKENRNNEIKGITGISKYEDAKKEYKLAKTNHKQIVNDANSDFIKKVG